MTAISEAVILMAGSGSRLRGRIQSLHKPLIPLLGRPLISYTIDALAGAGIKTINAIVGFESAALIAGLKPLIPSDVKFRWIDNPDWQKQNGISLLAAADQIGVPFLLAMSDHLYDKAIVDLVIRDGEASKLNMAIDRKIETIFDLEDAMKVQTRGERVIAIGKDLPDYDAIDIGLFLCPLEIFSYLERAKQNEDCALADGMRLMAAEGKVRAIDIGGAWWHDVDTPAMLQNAESALRAAGAQLRR